MRPLIPDRAEESLSVQAELAVGAAERALEAAGRSGAEVDLVIVGASSLQRPYPAIAIELQDALGARRGLRSRSAAPRPASASSSRARPSAPGARAARWSARRSCPPRTATSATARATSSSATPRRPP
ncbi:MAG: hypothetical protein M5U28_44510 [Sandaracinaceae bacterium]|nr:hypothetical protein [Sandaracinaceae bacterium]